MLCYLGCVLRTVPTLISPGIVRVDGPTWDMHGYMIRRPLWEAVRRDLRKVSSPKFVPERREDSAIDVILAKYHGQFPTYAVWPPLAWQCEGFSNNENNVRCNYFPNGRQRVIPEVARELDRLTGLAPTAVETPPMPLFSEIQSSDA